jgi:hypothetical protein
MAQELTVVVTGSTGKQGGAVARDLLERGHKAAPSRATPPQARPSCWRTLGRRSLRRRSKTLRRFRRRSKERPLSSR